MQFDFSNVKQIRQTRTPSTQAHKIFEHSKHIGHVRTRKDIEQVRMLSTRARLQSKHAGTKAKHVSTGACQARQTCEHVSMNEQCSLACKNQSVALQIN